MLDLDQNHPRNIQIKNIFQDLEIKLTLLINLKNHYKNIQIKYMARH